MYKKQIIAAAIGLALVGCGNSETNTETATQAPQATPVTVVTANAYEHQPINYFVGRMAAVESANLTPRASGFLVAKHFNDGAFIEKGDVIFEIDPTSYNAALDAAKATLAEANAAYALTQLNHERNTRMLKTGGMSQAQIDISIAELEMALSRVNSAKANVLVHEDNLAQTKVRAPYSGQLGKSKFSIGDMVGPSFGPLTDLVMTHPIKANFSVKEADLNLISLSENSTKRVTLDIDGNEHPNTGELTFIDNKVNATSGTIAVAASFNNEDSALLPNQFVRVGISDLNPTIGVKIPHKAIHQDAGEQFVMTIEDGVAQRRAVEVADRIGMNVVVTSGLGEGEPVIVGGLQRIRVGSPVAHAE
jgi:membrane fusion protein (multidrug efflux system)